MAIPPLGTDLIKFDTDSFGMIKESDFQSLREFSDADPSLISLRYHYGIYDEADHQALENRTSEVFNQRIQIDETSPIQVVELPPSEKSNPKRKNPEGEIEVQPGKRQRTPPPQNIASAVNILPPSNLPPPLHMLINIPPVTAHSQIPSLHQQFINTYSYNYASHSRETAPLEHSIPLQFSPQYELYQKPAENPFRGGSDTTNVSDEIYKLLPSGLVQKILEVREFNRHLIGDQEGRLKDVLRELRDLSITRESITREIMRRLVKRSPQVIAFLLSQRK